MRFKLIITLVASTCGAAAVAANARKKIITGLLFLLIALFRASFAHSDEGVTVSTIADLGTVDLVANGHVRYLHDNQSQLKAADLLAQADSPPGFEYLAQGQTNIGYRTGPIWGRFTLSNDTSEDQELWLALSIPRTERIAVYYPVANESLTILRSGSALPLSLRSMPTRDHVFSIPLAAGATLPVAISIQSGTSVSLRADLWQPGHYLVHAARAELVRNLINGVNLALLVFGILLLMITRDRLFLLFSVYVLSFSLYILAINGQAKVLFWPESGAWGTQAIVFFGCLSLVFLIALVRGVLESRRPLPRLARGFFRVEQMASLLIALSVFWLPYRYGGIGSTVVWLAFSTAVPPLAALRWVQGEREARVVLLGWGVFFLFAVLFSLEIFGAIPGFGAAVYLHFSMVGLAPVMALALSDRLRQLRRERSEAQHRAIQVEQESRKELEAKVEERTRKLAIAKKQAEEANARKSDFLAVANHELRTPLTTILGSLELMARAPMAQTQEATLVESIRLAGTHLQALIDNVLDFTRLDAGPPQAGQRPFQPAVLAQEAAAPFLALAEGRGLRFVRSVPEETPWVQGDPDRLRQVLINLLGNAFKYTATGRVALELTLTPGAKSDQVQLHWVVEDTGMGIPLAMQSDLFDPFKRHQPGARAAAEGIGLGLPISQSILQGMGSALTLDSEPSRGSRFAFTLDLPLASPPTVVEDLPSRPVPLRILLVEDHATNREIISQLLRADGHQVSTARDAASALVQLHQDHAETAPYDLVLLDIRLPDTSGPALAREIAKRMISPPLMIGLSASNTPVVEAQARQAGMTGLCGKPLNLARLYELLPRDWQKADAAASARPESGHANCPIDRDFVVELEAIVGPDQLATLWGKYLERSHAQHLEICSLLDREDPDSELLAEAFHGLANSAAGLGLLSLKSHCLHLEDLVRDGCQVRFRRIGSRISTSGRWQRRNGSAGCSGSRAHEAARCRHCNRWALPAGRGG